ncbi:helix-turn-helix transcriptional regulator [Myroides sp. 1354]|uniref:helix-turn-helix domain-containing protein n=1 Tax=unclassified Myroides TaxID=2642485 RepID=UPI0025784222|nr:MULTISPECIES: AraC family transcriptional regulator [unclassified Myroides]MDM1045649.1 helix-turn-helix transcriptional regulator [Myroides sp. R163-1]MDM1056651.1 helix-turn-helix transcriptional regulator [Myroides sp. 1354]MDM1069779.1 helix-turn-helix transcriptional regulator [Myroides sp. 1372]
MDNDWIVYVKNMVCPRCITVVQQELLKVEINAKAVQLGEIQLEKPLTKLKMEQLKIQLLQVGFEVLDDPKQIIVEQVKTKIIAYVQNKQYSHLNLSDYLTATSSLSYARIARLFVAHTTLTIEKYYILQRVEKVKELISYCELSLDEIAQQLHYKDVSHMSKQFKKTVGVAPSVYRKNQQFERKFLDHIIT